ncbi:MAG: type VI secretion system membrane subunit TssM [Candidatus Eisenbacteria bacterium]|nr:type VI secretion system membrane subunit TssM [Candidatus Eisenbacteria bacterium]
MILSRYTNPRFVALAALGVVIALGFFLRRHLVLFLVLTLVIALIVLALVLWRMMVELKTAKAGKEIQGDLDRQVEEEIQKSTFGQDVAVRNVKAEWDQAMAEFRKSPVGKRLGDRALAQLPMYFVIGPEGAGKSALIEESGLTSVLRDAQGRPKAVRGVGGGRDFSWWFTEQAFLLDMSGRTLKRSQFDDTDDWVAFLRSLQRQRPERPINGVVITVPVHEVAGGAKEKVDPLAVTLRERLRDLGHHLGMEFPVYVVFTHCDRIAGFAETFEGFGDEQAEQAWGATVSFAKSRETAAESLFEAEFGTLVATLGTLRTERVHALADDAQRMRALAFPAQIESLRPDLQHFIQQVFHKGKGPAEGGLFRGFYFVCSKVGGETVDRVIGAAAESAGLPPRLEAPTPEVARRAWFTTGLWRRIVLKDAMLASASQWARTAAQRKRWMLLGGVGGAYLLLTLLFVILAVNVARPVRDAASAARTLADLGDDFVPRQALGRLDAMRVALEKLEDNRAHKTFGMRLGAYAGDGVVDAARELYVRRAEQYLLQPIAKEVRDTLEAQLASDQSRFANLFYQYQAYRLLSDPHSTVEPSDSVVFGKVVVTMLRPELERVSDDSLRYYAALARAQARCLADHGEPKRRFGDFDEGLAARAIATLQRRWNEWPTLYDDMIADANEAIDGLTVKRILADAKKKQELFVDTGTLPGAYTRAGWEGFVRPRLAVMQHAVRREKDPELQAQLGAAVSGLTAELGKRYADDYVNAWVTFLTGLKGRPQGSKGRASLQREASFDSEIEAVLRRVRTETQLEGEPREIASVRERFGLFDIWLSPPKREGFAAFKSKVPFLRSDLDRSPEEDFRARLAAAAKAKDKQGIDGGMYKNVTIVALDFTDPASAPWRKTDPGVARALRAVLTIMKPFNVGGGGGGSIAAGGGGGGGGGATDPGDPVAFAQDWQAQVVAPFASMAGDYPFNAGGSDVKISEFSNYFKPGGGLDQVYNTHLKNRVSREGQEIGQQIAGTTPAMRAWVKKAFAIQDAFFSSGPEAKLMFDVKSKADQLKPAGALRSITWLVGTTSFFYEMGDDLPVTLTWSAENAGQGSSVGADVNGTPVDGPKAEGEWGLFRVLDKASLSPTAGDHVRATWRFGTVTMVVEIIPKTNVHPFVSGFLRLGPPPPAGGN